MVPRGGVRCGGIEFTAVKGIFWQSMHQLGCYAASTARFFAAAIFLASVFTLAPLQANARKTVLDLSWVAATA